MGSAFEKNDSKSTADERSPFAHQPCIRGIRRYRGRRNEPRQMEASGNLPRRDHAAALPPPTSGAEEHGCAPDRQAQQGEAAAGRRERGWHRIPAFGCASCTGTDRRNGSIRRQRPPLLTAQGCRKRPGSSNPNVQSGRIAQSSIGKRRPCEPETVAGMEQIRRNSWS